MKQFGHSLFPPVGISAGLMTMLLLLMVMPSSTDGFEIIVTADEKITKESNQITVVVQGSTTVKKLKEQIKKETGIPPRKQTLRLKQNGPEIEDEKTLTDYGIGNGTTIHLSIDKFRILVKYEEENEKKQYTFGMNRTDTVATLKEMIKNWSGIEVERQSLKLNKPDGCVTELEEDKKLGLFGVASRLTVELSIANLKILVKYEKGDEEKEHTVWVKGTDTVALLKKKIGNESGIEPGDQILKCNTTNGPLLEEDKKTLKEYGIENGTILFLSLEFEVVVEYVPNTDWKKYKITVKKRDTLATLKNKIREKYTEDYNEYGFGTIELVKEFKTDEREPFVMRNDVVLWHEDLDEYKTMDQCGIREGSMVSVFYARRLTKEEHDEGFYIRPYPIRKKIYL
ncbi:hypothetical protein niasHT_031799 [Heterodera trifolii]|uniref:Ubiquitin-like domain-containing protein n=1 Tax=Heterodera trifolii TaxID=157864 RepID=A0ABD2IQC3_9BILA